MSEAPPPECAVRMSRPGAGRTPACSANRCSASSTSSFSAPARCSAGKLYPRPDRPPKKLPRGKTRRVGLVRPADDLFRGSVKSRPLTGTMSAGSCIDRPRAAKPCRWTTTSMVPGDSMAFQVSTISGGVPACELSKGTCSTISCPAATCAGRPAGRDRIRRPRIRRSACSRSPGARERQGSRGRLDRQRFGHVRAFERPEQQLTRGEPGRRRHDLGITRLERDAAARARAAERDLEEDITRPRRTVDGLTRHADQVEPVADPAGERSRRDDTDIPGTRSREQP